MQSAAFPNPAPDSTSVILNVGAVPTSTLLERLLQSPVAQSSLTSTPPPHSTERPTQPTHPAELILHLFGSIPRTTSDLLFVKQKLAGLIAEIDLSLSRQVNQ